MLRSPASFVAPTLIETAGRAFASTPIHSQPLVTAPIITHLSPQAQVPILATISAGDWYQIPDGYVERTALQPIASYQRPTVETELGFYAEMIAPASTIREWCAARAPITAAIGYGAIVYVVDRLTDDSGGTWYGIAAQPQRPIIGWSPALHYARWQPTATAHRPTHLHFAANNLIAYQGQRAIAHLPAAAKGNLPKACRIKATSLTALGNNLPLGTPYHMQLNSGGLMYGSYWHNHFVREPRETDSNIQIDDKVTIELPIYAARWLYSAIGSDEMVMTIE